MKKCFLLFLIIGLWSCSSSSDKINSLERAGLKGDVAEVITLIYDAELKFGDIVKDDVDEIMHDEYNADGYLLTTTEYDDIAMGIDDISMKIKHTYDSDNNELSFAYYGYDGDVRYQSDYLYEKGKVVSFTSKGEYVSGGQYTEKYEYDKNGRIAKCVGQSEESRNTIIMLYNRSEYDEQNPSDVINEVRLLTKDGKILAFKRVNESGEFVRDSKGKITEFSYKGDVAKSCSFEYDKNGNLINIKGATFNFVTYFMTGIEAYIYPQQIMEFNEFAYVKVVYENDKKQNWIRATYESSDGKDTEYSILERSIQYR